MYQSEKTDVYTLHKKNNIFFQNSFSEKIKGAGHLLVQKLKILGQQKFLAHGVAGCPENGPDQCFDSSNRPP